MAVLYRKYRPTKLEDVVGQEQVTAVLANALKSGKIAHAYLFIGPRGTGKTSVARIFAHAVNGFDYKVEDNYLDIIEIDAASNTGVDNIRELREKATIAPTKGKYKVYIIDEVHMLTKSASNALLKTLEEPPAHVIFIMATTDAHKVPITISSRTQVHTFKLADPQTMQSHLRKIADQEQIKITDDALKIVVRRGGGSFRDTLSLLDQIASLSNDTITPELLNQALGLPAEQVIHELLTAYSTQDQSKIHQLLQELFQSGLRPEILASELIEKIISDPQPAYLSLLATLPEVNEPFPEAKLLLALLEPSLDGQNPQNNEQIRPKNPQNDVKTAQNAPQRPVAAPETPTKPLAPSDPTPTSEPAKTPGKPLSEPNPSADAPISAPKTPTNSAAEDTDFDWAKLLEALSVAHDALVAQLQKVGHLYQDHTLHLYPRQKFVKTVIEKPQNLAALSAQLQGTQFVVHEIDEPMPSEDPTISKISAIMGGVQEVEGELPF